MGDYRDIVIEDLAAENVSRAAALVTVRAEMLTFREMLQVALTEHVRLAKLIDRQRDRIAQLLDVDRPERRAA